MIRAGRFVGLPLAAAIVVSAAACTAGSSSSDEGAASCIYQVEYQGRTYQDVANVEFTVGAKLGDATQPPCDDTGGQDETEESGTTETAYEVDGISPKVAIAVGDTPGDAQFVAVYSGTELPPEVKKLIAGS
ncbi:DUF6281 family protein [Streptomyces sp. NPDC057740]|uniref:DUF6281 family protein n=1 Tax=Streptomyces sp. NPDC057740 TaxID=3346234 RepID=UPI003690C027